MCIRYIDISTYRIQFYLFISYSPLLAIQLKEIIIKDFGYSQQQIGVNRFFLKNLIHIGTRTRQTRGKPYNCHSLLFYFLLDFLSYMQHTHYTEMPLFGYKIKKDGGIFTMLTPDFQAFALPSHKDKQRVAPRRDVCI